MKTKITFIPDHKTMQSIEYDFFGRVKKIVFRPLSEIKENFPEYLNQKTQTMALVELKK